MTTATDAMSVYVLRSLSHHFQEALLDEPSEDTDAFDVWLKPKDPFIKFSCVIRSAIDAIGADALRLRTAAAEADGDIERAIYLQGCQAYLVRRPDACDTSAF